MRQGFASSVRVKIHDEKALAVACFNQIPMLILQHLANGLRKDQCPVTVLQALVNRAYHAIAADIGIEEVAGDPLLGLIFQQGAEQHSHFSVGQH